MPSPKRDHRITLQRIDHTLFPKYLSRTTSWISSRTGRENRYPPRNLFIPSFFQTMKTPKNTPAAAPAAKTAPEQINLFTASAVRIPKAALSILTNEHIRNISELHDLDQAEFAGNPETFTPHTLEGETNPILYGLELEYHTLNESVAFRRVLKAYQDEHKLDFFICKRDSSLSSGIEIITQPFSRKWFYAHQNILRNLMTMVYACGGKVNSGSGLHIHISRQGVTNKTKAKIFYFVNAKENRNLMTEISGRSSEQYAKYFSGIPLLSDEGMEYLERNSEKYEAVNWKHDDTIELRIFKSTTTTAKLFGRLEFLFSLFDFFRATPRTLDLIDQKYRDFIETSRYAYARELLVKDREY